MFFPVFRKTNQCWSFFVLSLWISVSRTGESVLAVISAVSCRCNISSHRAFCPRLETSKKNIKNIVLEAPEPAKNSSNNQGNQQKIHYLPTPSKDCHESNCWPQQTLHDGFQIYHRARPSMIQWMETELSFLSQILKAWFFVTYKLGVAKTQ